MTENQKDQYIELQRQFIQIALKRGHSMEELTALRKIENFEQSLECNLETESFVNGKFVAL